MVENFINNMKSTLGHVQAEFAASRLGESNFITFGYQDAIIEKKVGWKAHISIDDSDKENLAMAWDLVKDIIIDERLVVKVVIPSVDLFKDEDQCGKQITIYCHMTPGKDWEDIFHRIENALSCEDIKPFRFSESDRQIPGSKYLSYRNDDNGKGQYIASKTDYNPGRHVDTFRHIEVQPYGVRFR